MSSSTKTQKENKRLRNVYDSLEKYREVGEVIKDYHDDQFYVPRSNYGPGGKLLSPGVFRAKYIATPKWERMEELKKDYAKYLKQGPLDRDNIKVKYDLTDKELDLLIERRNQFELMEFDTWLAHTFKPDNPRTNRMLKKHAPGYYKRRKEQLKLVREYQNKIADIRMFGPKNEADLAFMFWYDQGLTTPMDQERGPHMKFTGPNDLDDNQKTPNMDHISNFAQHTRDSYNTEHPMRAYAIDNDPNNVLTNLGQERFQYR